MYAVSFSYLTQFSAVSLVYAFSVTAPVTVNFKKCAIMHENVPFWDENSREKTLERGPPPHTPLPLRLRSLEPPLLNCFRCPWSFPGLQRVGIGNLAEATCPTSQGIPSSRVGPAVHRYRNETFGIRAGTGAGVDNVQLPQRTFNIWISRSPQTQWFLRAQTRSSFPADISDVQLKTRSFKKKLLKLIF